MLYAIIDFRLFWSAYQWSWHDTLQVAVILLSFYEPLLNLGCSHSRSTRQITPIRVSSTIVGTNGTLRTIRRAKSEAIFGGSAVRLSCIIGQNQILHMYDHSFPLRSKAPKGMKHGISDAASKNLLNCT